MKGCVCKRTYHRTRGTKLQNTAEGINAGVFKNADIFKHPPTTDTDFAYLIKDYTDKRIAHDQGGTRQYQPYMASRGRLMDMIDDIADYIDIVAHFDRNIILLAGFETGYDPEKYRGKKTPATIRHLVLKNHKKCTGVLISYCKKFPPRTYFAAILLEGSPLPEGMKIFDDGAFDIPGGFNIPVSILTNTSRKKVISGLIPGKRYYIYYIAYNSRGYSKLSICAGVMCG